MARGPGIESLLPAICAGGSVLNLRNHDTAAPGESTLIAAGPAAIS